jgi:hypothetical protein
MRVAAAPSAAKKLGTSEGKAYCATSPVTAMPTNAPNHAHTALCTGAGHGELRRAKIR